MFTGINTLGLSIALAASFIIILFVINELNYNNCHKNRKSVYRVLNFYNAFDRTLTRTPFILASTLKEEFPQVEHAINTKNIRDFTIQYKGEDILVNNAVASSSEVFNIFTLPLINGNTTKALLEDKNAICLSRNLSEKLFSGTNAIGKEITASINKEEHVLTVTAVFEDIPQNSTFKAECLINNSFTITYANKHFGTTNAETNWDQNGWHTWVRLISESNTSLIDSQFSILENKHMGENPAYHYSLQNLSDVYFRSEKVMNNSIQGNWNSIKIFSAIALLIVLIAMINYIILSTAVSSGRSKEIGIRKTFGAKDNQIKYQLLTESIVLTIIVLPLAIVFMILGLPYAEELFQTNLPIIEANILYYILSYFILTVLIGIISGLYTSVGLSKLTILNILKDKNMTGKKKNFVRSGLIIFQLVIFCFFVASALVIRAQYQYSLEKNPGFHNKNVLLIDIKDRENYTPFLNEIQANPNVIMASGAYSGLPTYSFSAMMLAHHEDQEKKVEVEQMLIDFGFLKTMGISLTEGRYFSTDYGSDLANSCILNEVAVKALGIKDPIGKKNWRTDHCWCGERLLPSLFSLRHSSFENRFNREIS
ncbi:ABC transporter permease [Labilibaculum euxinus]